VDIEVIRSGGFAGITRRAVLATTGRPDAARVEGLARRALAEGQADAARVGHPDGYRYELRADGGTAFCADPALSPDQRELITLVLDEGSDKGPG
jgi:hypothetical protein